ncbi:hypothetical protein CUJ89_27210 [Burkholderia pyrrocinia]|uniref:Lipoprotein n=1 Tax=Burkholderia pyrrocinia TaxID=60550 RepID=A0A2Z5N3C5_BURPY|nr:hypothetical protein [Burkholderia pyrrocinia]AXF24035.1 hypothetical protein CUJ89_27210 [Burkholderia pyrrocinia]
MKLGFSVVALLLTLSACVGEEQSSAFRTSETQLLATRRTASLQCATESECDRAWNLTRHYIEDHSSTRITRFDTDLIETAQPYLPGKLYLWASRVASSDGSSVIRLKVMCKGMYGSDGGPGWQYQACASKILAIERGFRSYENQLSVPGTSTPSGMPLR